MTDLIALANTLALVGWAGGYAALFIAVFVLDHREPTLPLVAVWVLATACMFSLVGYWIPGPVTIGRAAAIILIVATEIALFSYAFFAG